jgi:hypothetical protein
VHFAMTPITQFSQLDLSKTYSYADCLTWQFPGYLELLHGKLLPLLPGASNHFRQFTAGVARLLHAASRLRVANTI